MATEIYSVTVNDVTHLVVREQGKRGRPKNRVIRLDGQPYVDSGRCPPDIAGAIERKRQAEAFAHG